MAKDITQATPHSKAQPLAENIVIADRLREYADLLDEQGEDGFRSRAYSRAADVVAALDRPVSNILKQEGRDGLEALPAIGEAIAGAIAQMVATGHWQQLERLCGELTPDVLFRSIPGIGERLARTLAEDGRFENLEDLEHAIHFGGLGVRGIGLRRKRMISAALAERLGRPATARPRDLPTQPPAALLLKVDRAYRDKAVSGELRMIAPKRFNPTHEAWLPIMHMRQGDWHFTALFSNSRRAHEFGKTRDWVVIYHQRNGEAEGRRVVVTGMRGPHRGKRIIRGNEVDQELSRQKGAEPRSRPM